MSEKEFEKMDAELMKATEELREKKVSEGMLKGFSASVERRLAGEEPQARPSRRLAWAPVMAVLVIASVIALRSPNMPQPGPVSAVSVEYAQLPALGELDEEIAALKEVGAWSDDDDALIGDLEEGELEDLEIT